MMDAIKRVVEPLYNRLNLVVQLGRVMLVDDGNPLQSMQVKTVYGDTLNAVPHYQPYGYTMVPPAGSQAVVLGIGGLRQNSLVLVAAAETARIVNLQPGESCLYTDEGPVIINRRGRKTELHCDTLTIFADTLARFETPMLQVTGEIMDRCDSDGKTMSGMRSVYNRHQHHGVKAGADLSGLPTVDE